MCSRYKVFPEKAHELLCHMKFQLDKTNVTSNLLYIKSASVNSKQGTPGKSL